MKRKIPKWALLVQLLWTLLLCSQYHDQIISPPLLKLLVLVFVLICDWGEHSHIWPFLHHRYQPLFLNQAAIGSVLLSCDLSRPTINHCTQKNQVAFNPLSYLDQTGPILWTRSLELLGSKKQKVWLQRHLTSAQNGFVHYPEGGVSHPLLPLQQCQSPSWPITAMAARRC